MQPSDAGEGSDGSREMSLPAVDSALDDVRPYLMADGGNVTVVEVADGIVRLRLEVRPVTSFLPQGAVAPVKFQSWCLAM